MTRKESMSNICIGLIRAAQIEHQQLREILIKVTHEVGVGVSFNLDWDEPIWDTCDENMLFFSICDSSISADCEMLFLPDGWFYNGKTNPIPLAYRMEFLQKIASVVLSMGYPIEFYVGTSGTMLRDYLESSVSLHNVGDFIANNLYSYTAYVNHSLHVIVEE
jgi:hypothetical protein